MSLINDALKRAKENQPNPSAPRSNRPAAAMRPAQPQGPALWPILVIPIVLLGVVALAVFLIVKGLMAGKSAVFNPEPAQVEARETKSPAQHPSTPSAPPSESALTTTQAGTLVPPSSKDASSNALNTSAGTSPAPKSPPAASTVPVAVSAPPSTPPTAAAPLPTKAASPTPAQPGAPGAEPETVETFPDLKLQGVFYRPSNPSVVIKGKNLYIGEQIEGAKVLQITRDTVTLEWKGQRKSLKLY